MLYQLPTFWFVVDVPAYLLPMIRFLAMVTPFLNLRLDPLKPELFAAACEEVTSEL